MKNFYSLSIVFLLFLASCAQYETTRTVKPNSASTHARLSAEPSEIWTRPLEVGFQVMGKPIDGRAESIVGDEILGTDEPNVKNFNLFASAKNPKLIAEFSPMLKKAALNAMKENDADGLYITMSEEIIEVIEDKKDEEVKKIKRYAQVRGIPLKMVVYDEISYEKSRTHKFCNQFCAEKENCPMACVFPQNELETLRIEYLENNKSKNSNDKTLPQANTNTNKTNKTTKGGLL